MITFTKKLQQRGDTIVEVLVCLVIAGSALTISYGTARRSLHQIRDAQERTEMISVGQAQIERFKQYVRLNPSFFNTITDPGPPVQGKVFCITEGLTPRIVSVPTPTDTTCAVDNTGTYYSGGSTDPLVVDATHPYRAVIVYHPTNTTTSERVDEFYVIAGRTGAGGYGNAAGFTVASLMYRQHP